MRDITHCPYCQGEEYYIKQSITGVTKYIIRFDGEETDNSHIHDHLSYKNVNKYAYCNDCGKRLFKIDDDWNLIT